MQAWSWGEDCELIKNRNQYKLSDILRTMFRILSILTGQWVAMGLRLIYTANMRTTQELAADLNKGADLMIGVLREAADNDLQAQALTELLEIAFTGRNQLEAALTTTVGALDQAVKRFPEGILPDRGLSCVEWLSHAQHISDQAAYAQVQLARKLPQLELTSTAQAFEQGQISAQHASVVARSVEMVIRGGGEPEKAESMLLEEARQTTPRELLRWGLNLVHQLAPREMEKEEERQEERRYLRLTERFNGGYDLEGYLDPIRGARLKTALEGVLGRRRKDDPRSPNQRRADGLDEIVTRVLDSGTLPANGGQRPHLSITATLGTLKADPGAPAALLDWGFPISARALREIAGDAELTPILTNANGDPLHVGRKYRTATAKMHKALDVRDRRCLFPGCSNWVKRTQAHHFDEWQAGGLTDIELMGLLCHRHHKMVHLGWRLEHLPDGSWFAHPPIGPRREFGPAVDPFFRLPPPYRRD